MGIPQQNDINPNSITCESINSKSAWLSEKLARWIVDPLWTIAWHSGPKRSGPNFTGPSTTMQLPYPYQSQSKLQPIATIPAR